MAEFVSLSLSSGCWQFRRPFHCFLSPFVLMPTVEKRHLICGQRVFRHGRDGIIDDEGRDDEEQNRLAQFWGLRLNKCVCWSVDVIHSKIYSLLHIIIFLLFKKHSVTFLFAYIVANKKAAERETRSGHPWTGVYAIAAGCDGARPRQTFRRSDDFDLTIFRQLLVVC